MSAMEPGGMVSRSVAGPAQGTALKETAFFRDREMFEALRDTVLPRLFAANAERRVLRVWCAGCSTGQEAYSVAMVLCEHFVREWEEWEIRIAGTDIAGDAVEYARRGRYRRAEVNRGLPARMLVRYFRREEEEWELAADLRGRCAFRGADVCAPDSGEDALDLVLMRNVLLFLPEQERAAAFANVGRQMAEHGVLVLGQAEQAEDWTAAFEAEYVHGCCFYRKATGP